MAYGRTQVKVVGWKLAQYSIVFLVNVSSVNNNWPIQTGLAKWCAWNIFEPFEKNVSLKNDSSILNYLFVYEIFAINQRYWCEQKEELREKYGSAALGMKNETRSLYFFGFPIYNFMAEWACDAKSWVNLSNCKRTHTVASRSAGTAAAADRATASIAAAAASAAYLV